MSIIYISVPSEHFEEFHDRLTHSSSVSFCVCSLAKYLPSSFSRFVLNPFVPSPFQLWPIHHSFAGEKYSSLSINVSVKNSHECRMSHDTSFCVNGLVYKVWEYIQTSDVCSDQKCKSSSHCCQSKEGVLEKTYAPSWVLTRSCHECHISRDSSFVLPGLVYKVWVYIQTFEICSDQKILCAILGVKLSTPRNFIFHLFLKALNCYLRVLQSLLLKQIQES